MFFIFELIIFLFAVILHEVAHGLVAEHLGDPTARQAGRLTLNPLAHIDPIGSVLLPILLAIPALYGAPTIIFGWAKPVPYNQNNLKNPRSGAVKIALAGPITNLLIALIFGLFLRAAIGYQMGTLILPLGLIIYINIVLGVFNLVPIPPLDGSKLLYLFLPQDQRGYRIMAVLERYGFIVLLAFLFWGFGIVSYVANLIFSLIVGHVAGF
ncbi:MAG: site-2 protease family protein [Candidatus Liptonbacteria bacterium]